MDPRTRDSIDAFWTSYYGVAQEALGAPGVRVVPHAGLAGYRGLHGFAREGSDLLISAPPERVDGLREAMDGWSLETLCDRERLRSLGLQPRAILGPAFLGYTDARCFRPAPSLSVRRLEPEDRNAWEALRGACDDGDWEHGGGDLEHPCAGWFEAGQLLALAHYELWGGSLAHIGVVTRPDAQGGGRGRAVVSALTGLALAEGLVPQYRTLEANRPSMALGRALGFEAYARTVAVRL